MRSRHDMTLDEAERLARIIVTGCAEEGSVRDELARAVLAMLPVVRAAEAWRASWPVTNRQSVIPEIAAVMDAIDTFRRALAEGE